MNPAYRQPSNSSSNWSSHFLGVAVTTGTPGTMGSLRSRLANSLFARFWIIQNGPASSSLHYNETEPRLDDQKEERGVADRCGSYPLAFFFPQWGANDEILFPMGEVPGEVQPLVDNEVDVS